MLNLFGLFNYMLSSLTYYVLCFRWKLLKDILRIILVEFYMFLFLFILFILFRLFRLFMLFMLFILLHLIIHSFLILNSFNTWHYFPSLFQTIINFFKYNFTFLYILILFSSYTIQILIIFDRTC